jgi:hypothetical protein
MDPFCQGSFFKAFYSLQLRVLNKCRSLSLDTNALKGALQRARSVAGWLEFGL